MNWARCRRTGIAVLLLGASAAGAEGQAERGGDTIRWAPYEARSGQRGVEGAQLGRLRVPENRSRPGGRTIDLAFVRLPGVNGRGVPTIYLDGGPGGGGVGVLNLPGWERLLAGLRTVGDVILLSQRGTGLTQPRLWCGGAGAAPLTVLRERADLLASAVPVVDACVARWRDSVDLTSYTTVESAADVEAVRRALGAAQVNLLGFSYGTHLALAVVRGHEAGVARVVLAGTEGPEDTYKLPSTLDTQLRNISRLVAEDSSTGAELPDLYGTIGAVLGELAAQPRELQLSDGRRIMLGADGLRYLIRQDLGDSNDLPMLPALIQDARTEGAPGLARLAERRYQGMGGVNLMGLLMDCASAASASRLARIRAEAPNTLLGEMSDLIFPDICERLPIEPLGEEFRAPVRSGVATLFVSGTLDANTPPYQAEQVRWGLPNSAHVIVEHAGHESTLPLPEVQDAIVAFLKTGELRSATLRAPRPDFLTRAEAMRLLERR